MFSSQGKSGRASPGARKPETEEPKQATHTPTKAGQAHPKARNRTQGDSTEQGQTTGKARHNPRTNPPNNPKQHDNHRTHPKQGNPKTQTAHNHTGRRNDLCLGPPSLEQVEDERVVEGLDEAVHEVRRPLCAVPEGSVLAQGCGHREVPVDELPTVHWPRPCKRGKKYAGAFYVRS